MDIWGPVTPPTTYGQHFNTFLAAKRGLYIALQHAELAVDMVVEDDIGPTLNSYKLIVLADTHVTNKAAAGLAAWVAAGGTLFATAGAGMFDELNKTNAVMSKLLGITGQATYEPTPAHGSGVQFLKQDLHNSTMLGTVQWALQGCAAALHTACDQHRSDAADCAQCAGGTQHDLRAAGCSEAQIEAWCNDTGAAPQNSSAPVIALRHFFKPAAGASVIATFDDAAQTPAAVHAASGKGSSLYYSFLPGLSYFLPALPVRPTDRGGTDDAYTHFIPSNWSQDVLGLIQNASAAAGVKKQVTCSNPLVHGKPVVSKTKGVVVPLVNWAGSGIDNLTNLTVTVNIPEVKPGMKATMATGGKVTELPASGSGAAAGVSFSLDLGIADALILRH